MSTPTANTQLALRSLNHALSLVADRRAVPVGLVRSDAVQWVTRWWTERENIEEPTFALPVVAQLVGQNAALYGVWHRVGPDGQSGVGFLALHRVAIREARGNVERGTEAASETYLDVRERLEATVDRAQRGRSLADFSKPSPNGEQNVQRYHTIQARLRLQGKWSRQRAQEAYEDTRQGQEHSAYRQVEARTYTVPVHFAAWWTLVDTKQKQTRDGRVKGEAWWWQMLLHALDVVKLGELGSDRNDPTEALMRMRLRFAVTQGLAGWLRVWAKQHVYWRQLSFGLPDPEHVPARETMNQALAQIRPALERCLEQLDATDRERRALRGTLIRGENVRTSIRHMSGTDNESRTRRFLHLGEALGRATTDDLNGVDGGTGVHGGGGGGGGHHNHATSVMAKMASGGPPSLEDIQTLRSAVAECEHCRAHWGAEVDAEPYLHAAAQAPVVSQPWAQATRWTGAGGLLMVAAAVMLWMAAPTQPNVLLRGAAADPTVHFDLYVVPAGGDASERLEQSRVYDAGDTVYFRVSADSPSQVRVWVDGPEGFETLATQPVNSQPQNLGGESQAVWYQFERPGRYIFSASTSGDERCDAPSCAQTQVEVR